MDVAKKLFDKASKAYNSKTPHYQMCLDLILHCHKKLETQSEFQHFGYFNGKPRVAYNVFMLTESVSRPVRVDLYIVDGKNFIWEHDHVTKILLDPSHAWTVEDHDKANRMVYTAVMAIACCFDLWQRGSRKTPGTFFEVFMAGILKSVFPKAVFSKHISLADIINDTDIVDAEPVAAGPPAEDNDEKASVSTDIVMGALGRLGGVVIPLKITTRERIVQPFAHQRILDSAFGEGHYQSLIVCISETQLDDKTKTVKQVCVPGTIKLFQKYLAPVYGLYYCDLPQRYATKDMARIINVRTVGHLFEDIRSVLSAVK